MTRTPNDLPGAAVLGLGIGMEHADACAASPRCHLEAVCDRDPARLAAARARFPGVRTESDASAVLDDPDIGIVCVSTWDDSHADLVCAALERGKHVFVEKPLCLRELDLFRIRCALEGRPRARLSGNLILRRCPLFRNLRDTVSRDGLGRVYCLEADYLYGRPERLTGGWRAEQPFYSMVHGGMVHMADLVLWIHGRRTVEVRAVSSGIALDSTPYRFPDTFLALVRFEDGSVAKLGVNGACVRPHFHALTLYGTKATFAHSDHGAALWRSRDPGAVPEPFPGEYPGYRKGDLMSGFLDALALGHEPEVTEADLFRVTALCLAVEQSAAEGKPVPVRQWPELQETQ
jgi:predicted dehydrogenase